MHLVPRTDYDRHSAYIVPIFLVCFVLVIAVFTGGVLVLNRGPPRRKHTDGEDTTVPDKERPRRIPLARLLSVISGRKALRESQVIEKEIEEPPTITITSASLPADLHRAGSDEDEKSHLPAFSNLAPRHGFLQPPMAHRPRIDDRSPAQDEQMEDEVDALAAIWDSFCASGEGRLHELRTLSYLSFGPQDSLSTRSKYEEATSGRLDGDLDTTPIARASPLPPPGLAMRPCVLTGATIDDSKDTSTSTSQPLAQFPLQKSVHPKGSYWSPERKPRWNVSLFGRSAKPKNKTDDLAVPPLDLPPAVSPIPLLAVVLPTSPAPEKPSATMDGIPTIVLTMPDTEDRTHIPTGIGIALDPERGTAMLDGQGGICMDLAAIGREAHFDNSPTERLSGATNGTTPDEELKEMHAVKIADYENPNVAHDFGNDSADPKAAPTTGVRRVSLRARPRSLARAPTVRADIFTV